MKTFKKAVSHIAQVEEQLFRSLTNHWSFCTVKSLTKKSIYHLEIKYSYTAWLNSSFFLFLKCGMHIDSVIKFIIFVIFKKLATLTQIIWNKWAIDWTVKQNTQAWLYWFSELKKIQKFNKIFATYWLVFFVFILFFLFI